MSVPDPLAARGEAPGWPTADGAEPPIGALSRVERAIIYAVRAHSRQRRKGTATPYIVHPLSVATEVLAAGGSDDEVIAALFHDLVEDQGGPARLTDIRDRFGAAVADIVEGCTDALETPKPPWRGRKERYLAHLREAPPSVLRVSAADKLDNARAILRDHRAIGPAVFSRFNVGKAETLWYYRRLVEEFQAASPGPLVDELARVVADLCREAGEPLTSD